MITSVEVRNTDAALLAEIPVFNANLNSPYVVKNIDGLGPVSSQMTQTGYAGVDGAMLSGQRRGGRSVTLQIAYRPNWRSAETVQSLRNDLYSVFPVAKTVRLWFNNSVSGKSRWFEGVVDAHDPVLFTKDPMVSITVLASDPDLKPLSTDTFAGFLNVPTAINYMGEIETGFLLSFYPTRNFGSLRIQNGLDPDIFLQGEILAGDVLTVSTVRQSKFIELLRGTTKINVLDYLSTGLMSMRLSKETQTFNVIGSGANDVPWSVRYTSRFSGV